MTLINNCRSNYSADVFYNIASPVYMHKLNSIRWKTMHNDTQGWCMIIIYVPEWHQCAGWYQIILHGKQN